MPKATSKSRNVPDAFDALSDASDNQQEEDLCLFWRTLCLFWRAKRKKEDLPAPD